jgi:hypothetical protein
MDMLHISIVSEQKCTKKNINKEKTKKDGKK